MPHVACHMPHVTCHKPHVNPTCHMSHPTYHISHIKLSIWMGRADVPWDHYRGCGRHLAGIYTYIYTHVTSSLIVKGTIKIWLGLWWHWPGWHTSLVHFNHLINRWRWRRRWWRRRRRRRRRRWRRRRRRRWWWRRRRRRRWRRWWQTHRSWFIDHGILTGRLWVLMYMYKAQRNMATCNKYLLAPSKL